jgi:Flp pilus assembly protein TadD
MTSIGREIVWNNMPFFLFSSEIWLVLAVSIEVGLMIREDTRRHVQAALDHNDFGRAGMVAETALANGESHEMLFSLAAFRRQQAGDARGAAALHMSAVQMAPDDPSILTAAGDSLRYTGQFTESLVMFDDALARDPMHVAAWYGRALALESCGSLEAARRSYRRVSELAPQTAPGFAGLATTNAQLGNTTDARRFAQQAYGLAPNDPAVVMALARCELADGHQDKAVNLLHRLSGRTDMSVQDSVAVSTLLGDALDGLGDTVAAFAAYTEANLRFAEVNAGPNAPPVARRQVEEIDAALANLEADTWKSVAPDSACKAAGHIFLIGYPRSGTTLVEQVLATLPEVVTLEEAPTLTEVEPYLNTQGIVALQTLADEDATRMRAAYWQRVEAAGADVAGKTFVDMDPFKNIALPAIARLFPDAKIVIMQRDPRDVVWSCFRRAFLFNPVTYEFTSLKRTARHYDAVMRLTDRCLQLLPIHAHKLAYEDLVRDFDGVTQRLCAFVGLPWSPTIRNFSTTARLGRVKTASAAQVRGSLFDGSGQWQRYADQLKPILPILDRWIW